MGLVYNPIHNRKDNMNAEIIARLLMVLTGFVLAMLGVIVFIHGEHYSIGILISFAGVVSMFGGLPDNA